MSEKPLLVDMRRPIVYDAPIPEVWSCVQAAGTPLFGWDSSTSFATASG